MLYILLLVLVGIIFHTWFTVLPISSGDMGFFHQEQIASYLNPPFMWETFRNLGFGGVGFISQGVYLYNFPFGFLGKFLDFGVIERIIWFFPILAIGVVSPLFLAKRLALFPPRFYPLATLIYLLNTYFLMVMGGGQITVVFGYIAIPLVFALFIAAIQGTRLSSSIIFSLVLSLLVFADYRFVYIFLLVAFVYVIFFVFDDLSMDTFGKLAKQYIILIMITGVIVIGIHAFWLLPFLSHFSDPTTSVGNAYTSIDAVEYFSFATFEKSLSLLHPYWPENIFGKVGFMKPEFLFLPLLAFTSLFFISKKQKEKSKVVVFFAFMGLLGAFLGKGANPPFGDIYLWMFHHIPGFIMFRDPTKWYTIVAVSYSVLIPFAVWSIYNLLRERLKNSKFKIQNLKIQVKIQKFVSNGFLLFVTLYLIFLIHPAVLGQLGGTLKPVQIPQEYIDYKNFLLQQDGFFRVLWIPTTERFTYYSDIHPAIPGNYFFDNYDTHGVIESVKKSNVQHILVQSGVKYIAVADDTQKEIYLKDRKYDGSQYAATVEMMEEIPWLHLAKRFGNIVLFELDDPKDHFWTNVSRLSLKATYKNPTEYTLEIKNARIGDRVVFAETYDSGWSMQDGMLEKHTVSDRLTFNVFSLQKSGDYTTSVTYVPQSIVPLAGGISIITGFVSLGVLAVLLIKQRQNI